MIPVWATVSVRTRGARPFRLWVPLFLVWLLLAPLMLLSTPGFLIVCLFYRVNPIALLANLGGLLSGLTGTLVEIESPDASVLVRVV